MTLVCPKCGSGDVRSYRAIYESGTHVGSVAGYQHTVSSTLAATVQPPQDSPKVGRVGCSAVLTLFAPFVIASFVPGWWNGNVRGIALVVLFALGVYVTIRVFRGARDAGYPARAQAWNRSYYCMRCSHRFLL